MSNNSNNGFIKIPRALLSDPRWKSLMLKDRYLFLVLLEHAIFRKQEFNDHGHLIHLEPGQLCISVRQLEKLADNMLSKNDLERGLARLKVRQFLRQEVRHKKTIITITYPGIYEDEKNESETKSETKSEQKVRQSRDIKEERKEIKKEYNNIAQTASRPRKKDDFYFSFEMNKFDGITESDLTSWAEAYPHANIQQELAKASEWIQSNPSKSNKTLWRKFITNWLSRASDKCFNQKAFTSIYKKESQLINIEHFDENKAFAQRIEIEWISNTSRFEALSKHAEFSNQGAYANTFILPYDTHGFKDQVMNNLQKRKFQKKELSHG